MAGFSLHGLIDDGVTSCGQIYAAEASGALDMMRIKRVKASDMDHCSSIYIESPTYLDACQANVTGTDPISSDLPRRLNGPVVGQAFHSATYQSPPSATSHTRHGWVPCGDPKVGLLRTRRLHHPAVCGPARSWLVPAAGWEAGPHIRSNHKVNALGSAPQPQDTE